MRNGGGRKTSDLTHLDYYITNILLYYNEACAEFFGHYQKKNSQWSSIWRTFACNNFKVKVNTVLLQW